VANIPIDTDDPNNITVFVQGTKIGADLDLVWTLNGPVREVDGVGWTNASRFNQRDEVYWNGAPAWRYELPIILHAGPTHARLAYVARQWSAVRAMVESPAGGGQPRLASLLGPLLPIEGTDFAMTAPPVADYVEYGPLRGALRVWIGTLTVTKLPSRDSIRISGFPQQPHRTHVVKPGETLAQIAAAEHVKIKDITYRGGKKITDPKKIKPLDVLWLPPRGHK
jgi:hypothetical protein